MPVTPELLLDGPNDSEWTIALAHGAGAGMDTPFMNAFAQGLASRGSHVARFEFPYMASYRRTGQKKPPDREPILRAAWLQVIERLGRERLVIGGEGRWDRKLGGASVFWRSFT